MKTFFKIFAYCIIGIIACLTVGYFALNEKMPTGEKGEKAEALAQKMLQAVNKTAWDSTQIISWTHKSTHHYLWDKKRNLAQVQWDTYKVLLNANNISGIVSQNEQIIKDPTEANKILQKTYKMFINDAFWLNPIVKIYDNGVERKLVKRNNGEEALLVTYASGGVTPGDSYLWLSDTNGVPTAWKIWAKILPIGGVEFSWSDWQTLGTGAKVATMHQSKPFSLQLPVTNLKAATNAMNFGWKEDPFSAIQ
jgi:hypothetical protein